MDYLPYYTRTIQNYDKGFKLVVGGTGLGKTSIIPKVIRESVASDKKCIYIANRHQLLDEMETHLTGLEKDAFSKDEYWRLPRDLDAVLQTLKNHRGRVEQWLNDNRFQKTAIEAGVDLVRVRRISEELSEIGDSRSITREREKERLDEDARNVVMLAFRTVIQNATKEFKEKLLDDVVIQSLFPFIGFKRHKQARILLVTLHKAFHGFFDGEKRINLSDLSNYIIFLDEFDFLENDLIGLICQAPQIDDIFRFVEFFYREMERHKLPLPTYPAPHAENYRHRIEGIQKSVATLQERGIAYPDLNQFTYTPTDEKQSSQKKDASLKGTHAAIFRTSHVVTSRNLHLMQTDRAFNIVDQRLENSFPAQQLFGRVAGISERVISLMKELEGEYPTIYEEMREQCFRSTVFYDKLQQLTYFPRPRKNRKLRNRRDMLLEHGYNLYDIRDLKHETDREAVELRHYSIYTTPEHILSTLIKSNLVLGLSATADIPRCVHHFDMEWLSHQSEVKVIDIDDDDKADISQMNNEKKAKRSTKVDVIQLVELSDLNVASLQRGIDHVARDPEFGKDTRDSRLKQRVEHFFATLLWVCNKPDEVAGLSHLLFFNSFHQIRIALKKIGAIYTDISVSQRTEETNRWFEVYDLAFCNQDFIVVFYNAERAREIHVSKDAENAFNSLFHEGKSVFVVTQYLSAGNGVNLQYKPHPESKDNQKQDFLNLHLLEVPYFYFGNPEKEETEARRIVTLKENIWYQAKLHTAKYISDARFQHILSELHESSSWNTDYKRHGGTRSDALLNNMAAFIQALGRVERTRLRTPRQTVVMQHEVKDIFQAFLTEHDYIRQERDGIISDNLRQVLEQIEKQLPEYHRKRREQKDSSLAMVNAQCRDNIIALAHSLEFVRQGTGQAIRQEWEDLREAALRHDFHHQMIQKQRAIHTSPLLIKGRLYLNDENEIIPESLYNSITDWCWRLDMVYHTIAEYREIRQHFAKHGYEMSFKNGNQYFFVPYFYQAILMGAIGEEACRALLRHQKIELESMPDVLYETADLKIKHLPYYVDCKNYSDATMARFALPDDDLDWHSSFDTSNFIDKAVRKWQQIADYETETPKLIYLNLASQHEARAEYYDEYFDEVTNFDTARIIIVRGCLQLGKEKGYHPAFELFLYNLKRVL